MQGGNQANCQADWSSPRGHSPNPVQSAPSCNLGTLPVSQGDSAGSNPEPTGAENSEAAAAVPGKEEIGLRASDRKTLTARIGTAAHQHSTDWACAGGPTEMALFSSGGTPGECHPISPFVASHPLPQAQEVEEKWCSSPLPHSARGAAAVATWVISTGGDRALAKAGMQ
ncbi:hypothetical protein NDU88_003832 [Pleurodeles waltl]|uniref:Uncharacterized protein n=1 Tax=Pleurodeles waltl TaxID=8319 RepID=A0AAV7UDP2_PLEWA|nr:hypothetical protein NDU88_003832 [Pleurodeles waltl]